MRIVRINEIAGTPWKNGGGVTREIARDDAGGTFGWRLSVAEVTAPGPFSAFPGLTRILTVLTGAGLVLRTPEGVIEAEALRPVRFSGDLPVTCSLIAGPVQDFNVIFDAARINASVTLLAGPQESEEDGADTALLCLTGAIRAEGRPLPPGDLALGHGRLVLASGARALLVRLARATH